MILHPLSQPVHCLSAEIRSLSTHPILSLPRNHAFTIKTTASYLEKSLSTSKLLISTLEIHHHFVALNCPPFCLLFSKPTLTVSFEIKTTFYYFQSNYIIKIIFRSGNHPHNQWNRRSCMRHCLRCLLWVVPWVPHGIDKSREQQPLWVLSHTTCCEPHKKG